MILNKNNLCYISIPKNGSTTISKHLQDLHWQNIDIWNINKEHTLFTILRDPLQRWISGFVEDVYTNLDNEFFSRKIITEIESRDSWFLDWIFFSRSFNIGFHTSLQKDWVLPSFHSQMIYFKLDDNLNFKLHHWLVGEGLHNDFLTLKKQNIKHTTSMYNAIDEYLFDAKNRHNKEKLLEYLKPDYDFINSIKFY